MHTESSQDSQHPADNFKGSRLISSSPPDVSIIEIDHPLTSTHVPGPTKSLAQRRGFTAEPVLLSPIPSLGHGEIPPTPSAPLRAKRPCLSKLSRFQYNMPHAQPDSIQVEQIPHQVKRVSCRGRLYMSSATSPLPKAQRLFHSLGQNLYIEKISQGNDDRFMRISLWHTNAIDKLQRAAARYSALLNFDALAQIESSMDDIMTSLGLIDNSHFVGFALHLGAMLFLTVEPDRCHVSIRKWYKPTATKQEPEGDLKPCRDGIMLNYDQFNKFVQFMQNDLLQHFPDYAMHVFGCDRTDHDETDCTMCNVKGLLPMQRTYNNHLTAGMLHHTFSF